MDKNRVNRVFTPFSNERASPKQSLGCLSDIYALPPTSLMQSAYNLRYIWLAEQICIRNNFFFW